MKKLYRGIREFMRNMRQEHISSFSAGSAFFIFLSFIPLLMLLSAAITYTPLTQKDLTDAVREVVPEALEDFVTAVIVDVYERAQALLPVASIILLWTAGKGVLSIVQGLNAIHQVEEERGFFRLRLLAMFYTVVLLLVILLELGVLSFGNFFMSMLERHVPALQVVWSILFPCRFLLYWLIMTFFFSVVYAFVPNKRLKVRHQVPGACFAAVAWSVFSFGFSVYLKLGNTFDVYGSLAILIVLMVWLYFCMYIVFVGAYMNRYFSA